MAIAARTGRMTSDTAPSARSKGQADEQRGAGLAFPTRLMLPGRIKVEHWLDTNDMELDPPEDSAGS